MPAGNRPGLSDAEKALSDKMNTFYEDPEGFVLYAFPWGEGELSEHPDGPDKWQREQMREIREQIEADPSGYVLRFATATGHGVGKACTILQDVPTPNGINKLGNIKVGDYVFGRDGSPTKVKGVFPQGVRPMYRVTFDDGSSILADADHNWSVKGRAQRRWGEDHPKSVWITLTTQEILDKGVKRKNGKAMAREWELPVQGAVEFAGKPLPMDSYTIGALIGDGCGGGIIANPDKEVFENIAKAHDISTHPSSSACLDGRLYRHGIKGIVPALKELGLHGKRSYEKFIPDAVKYSSSYDRSRCLMGLMDTDGYIDDRGICSYTTTSPRLAEDVIYLARSLGAKARLQPTVKKAKYRNDEGDIVNCRDAYNVTVTAPLSLKIFSVKHKAERRKEVQQRYISRWIESIEYESDEEAVCIAVEAEDSLFQVGQEFIVTHNSTMVAWLILWFLSTRYPAKGVTTANTLNQLSGKTWAELSLWHNRAINKHWFTWTATSIYLNEAPKINFVDATPNNKDNSEAFAGLHQLHVIIIMDESSGIPDKIWEVCDGAMTTPRAMMFCYGNPTQATGRFRECFGSRKEYWTTRSIDSRTCKMTNKEEIAKWEKQEGEDSDFFRVRVKGVFPSQAANQFISSDDVNDARNRNIDIEPYSVLPVIMGVDVARFGSDESALCVIKGRKMLALEGMRKQDTMFIAAWVAEAIKEYDPDIINVDGVGLGAGVVDRLRLQGFNISEVNGGFAPSTKKQAEIVINRRTEMWHGMREWLRSADIIDDQVLHDDLIGPTYRYDDKMRLRLERKEEMADRGLNSPDRGDALSMCFFDLYPAQMQGQSHIPDEAEFV